LICKELPEKDYETWILELNPTNFEDDTLTLEAPFGLFRDRVRQAYLPAIERAVSVAADRRCRVAVVVGSLGRTRAATQDSPRPAGGLAVKRPTNLIGRKTFENFIVGESNRLAWAASRQLADGDVSPGNPLFLYGGVGLGKTHLLLAIAHKLKLRGRRVLYYQGEDFTRKMVEALRLDRMDAFRREFQIADALLIDDIQFIAGKKRTQQEFYHAFNLLHGAGKPIAIAGDRGRQTATVEPGWTPESRRCRASRFARAFSWPCVSDPLRPVTACAAGIRRTWAVKSSATLASRGYACRVAFNSTTR